MGKLLKVGLFILFCLSSLAGCFDAEDIENFNIPLIAAYDVAENREEGVDVTVLYPNVAQRNREFVEKISGKAIGDTRAGRGTRYPSTLLLGDIQVALYGKDLACQGLGPYIDNYVRDPRIKKSLFMVVVEGRGDQFLERAHKINPYLGFEIPGLFTSKKKNQFYAVTTLHDFFHAVNTAGKNPVVCTMEVLPNGQYRVSGTAIFKKDRMIDVVGMDETIPLILLRGEEGCCGFIPFVVKKDGKVIDKGTVEINSKRKVRVQREGEKFIFYIKLKITGRLVEHYATNRLILEDKNCIKDIEKALAGQIKKEGVKLIHRMQDEWRVDCLDITKYALAKWRKEIKDVVEEETFVKNADIRLEVEVDIPFWGAKN
ncbi:germination protein, Ger(x)C family [Thermosyntropha lipolytica DSM 11003]|uniref:Germination protein, Ger(X)C family n=1 Tax=Thermosyntropha lipolytica DSM 11003 TaxID=1123382 RepID=A0A1M5NKH2_9FIRM|nr:Ger(x)C family spore germination protein [Thermosyntropha lipolytica]SHG90086.1 germination protein, Ger(x)C family [Thermosyntropha lipolytica DSM 11003]